MVFFRSGNLKVFLLFISTFHFSGQVFSKNSDSTQSIGRFSGAVSVTNNGISLLPSFSLGKPAAIFDLVLAQKKLSFEPQLRFSMEGKPWTFLFWWRYQAVQMRRFLLNVGVHPAIAFKEKMVIVDNNSRPIVQAQRFVAVEVLPTYILTKKISIGFYYLYSRGLEADATRNTHFLAVRTSLANIKLPKQLFLKFMPQVYYLKMDQKDGLYVNSNLTLGRQNFPLSVASIVSKSIRTHINTGKAFVWNISLNYSFGRNYIGK
ncbi:hypothetical protein [Emticicia sp. 17c]|uniref:hypothetical protein n=1 Tax=Emticicia sp. 17c TaxID=3127704 RepID=UPI00301D76E5